MCCFHIEVSNILKSFYQLVVERLRNHMEEKGREYAARRTGVERPLKWSGGWAAAAAAARLMKCFVRRVMSSVPVRVPLIWCAVSLRLGVDITSAECTNHT